METPSTILLSQYNIRSYRYTRSLTCADNGLAAIHAQDRSVAATHVGYG